MERFNEILDKIRKYFLVGVIGVLVVVIYFKNNTIFKQGELLKKPKIELVYEYKTDTIRDSIPVPYEVVKWKPSDPVEVEVIKYIEPSKIDSAKVVKEYFKVYSAYASTKLYDNVLKDDSLAYIRLKEATQYNSIFDRELIYEHRTPTVYITQPPKHIHTSSIVGGIEAGAGGVSVGVGLVTKKNSIYQISYDPFTQTGRGGVFLPIFNFRK